MRTIVLGGILGALAVFGCSAANSEDGSGGGAGSGSGGASASGGTGGSIIGTGGAAASGGGGFGGECAAVKQTASAVALPADIVWAIDTSCSMDQESTWVHDNMNQFSQQIAASGVDTHIILIADYPIEICLPGFPCIKTGVCIDPPLGSGLCPQQDTNPAANYWHMNQGVASNDALDVLINTYSTYSYLLRPDASKTFVVITDDNATEPPMNSADAFINAVNNLDPVLFKEWSFFSIHCYSQCASAAATGSVYTDLVQKKAGVSGDLCLQDFKPVFDKLAQGVIGKSKLECTWSIPDPGNGETINPKKVNVRFTPSAGAPVDIYHVNSATDCTPAGGWYYDNDQNPTQVIACPATCSTIQADDQGSIDVLFGCDTVQVPR
ncbi:MAG: hypothetical protein KC776_08685 [Myxococcales bacterium]|nr:hypothetical protein [Myxococcales bacterium]MCB9575863.1 hypothetical protein [Polyangiaceae bacterium]